MSAQSGKKKRLGSRRRLGNQSETSEPDEFHVKDSSSVAQPNIPEGNTLSNPDYSQSETKHPPSPELTVNRRKLGSSRRSKGRQHVKDSVTEPYDKPREDVEVNTSNETLEITQMSLPIQPERQTELSQGNEHDILYVTHHSSLYSDTTPGYSSEVQNPSCSEVDLKSLIPKNENLQAEHDQRETDCKLVSDSCKSVEIMLGGVDKSDTLQTAEVSDQVEENAHHVGTSEFNSSCLHLSPTVDQQLIDQSKSKEIPGEKFPSVYSVTDAENKKRDNDTDLLRQDGNLQGNYLVSESYVKSEDVEFYTTPETTTNKSSLGENTEIEFSVKQATFSLPTEELSTNEELNEHFNLSEVKDSPHSEDAVNKVHAQEAKHTHMQEMHEIDYSSESVIHDVTERSDTCSENLIDQAEIRDTYQSELSVKSSDDSATKQEISNPDKKQGEHPIKESNVGTLDQRNEDDHVSITKEPWISNTTPCHVCEGEAQVEDDIKPSDEETVHQEREEVLYKVEERESSLQTQQSEINAPLDSQPQDDSVSIEEQTDSSFKPIGNRRKMGSSRRNRGSRHIKDPVAESYCEPSEEVVGNTRDNEALETTKMSLIIEAVVEENPMETMREEMDKLDTSQTEEVSDQVKENAYVGTLVGISELTGSSLNSSSTVDQQIIDQSNSSEMPKEELPNVYSVTDTENKERDEDTELLGQHGHLVSESYVKSEDMEFSTTLEITNEKSSDEENTEIVYSVEKATLSSPNGELSTNEELNEHFNLSEVKDAQHSEDAVNKEHKEEVKATQIQEMHEIDYSSESVIHGATERSDTCSENLIDQAEIRDKYQSELSVKSSDDSAAKQELSNLDDKQDEHPIKESNVESLDQRNEDDHVSNTKEPWISNIAPCQVYEGEAQVEDDIKPSDEETVHQEREEVLYKVEERESSLQTQQSEINAPLDSEPQDDSVSIEEQTDSSFKPIGNRRKMGSSRRNRGRRHIKDPVAESYQEPTVEVVGNTRDNEALETTNVSLIIETTVEEKSVETMLEEMDKLDTSHTDEVSDQVKETAQEMPNEELPDVYSVTYTENKERDEDTELLGQHGHLQGNYLVSESHIKSEDVEFFTTPEITTEKSSLGENTEIVYSAKKATFLSQNGKLSTNEEQNEHFIFTEVRGAHHSLDTVNKVHEQEVKPTQMHEMDQIDYSSVKEGKSTLHTPGIHAPLDSQPQDDSVSIKAQTHTGFNPTVHRRKLGSSRRLKGRQPVKDSVAVSDMDPKDEVIENTCGDEAFETMKMSSATETTRQEEFKEQTDPGLKPAEEVRRICSIVNEEDNTENMQEGDTILSENVADNSAIVTPNITLSSDKDDSVKSNKEVSEKEKKLIEEPMIKMDSPEVSVWKEDSDIHSISYHGNDVTTGSSTLDVFKQEEAVQVHNMEAISSDKESLTNNMMDTEEDVMVKDMTDYSENLQIKSKQKRRKMGSTRRNLYKQEGGMDNTDETEESDLHAESDIRNLDKVEEVVPMVETTDVSQNENAKLSLSTVHEEQQEMNEASTVQDQERMVRSSTSYLHSTESSMISDIDDLMSLLPEQSASFSDEVVNAIKCFQVPDIGDSERNVVVSVEISLADDVTSTETVCGTTQSDEKGPKDVKVIQGQDTNEPQALKQTTEVSGVTVADLEIVKSVIGGGAGEGHEKAQADIQELKDVNEGSHNTDFEMKNASPNLNVTHRRRKMGSTRRNLGTLSKGEDLHQKQEVDNEATETNVGDVMTERFSGIKEKELQKEHKDSDSEPGKEKVFETVEYSHTGDSYTKPPGHQTVEENPVSGQLVETEHHLTPNDIPVKLATSPKHDAMSESAYGGRKRKMGSHRKSRGHQPAREDRIIDTQTGRDIKTITEESGIKTLEEHREESLGLDKKSEVIESDKKPSSNISISKTGEHSRPVSEKTPVQHCYAEVRLGQESQTSLSLAGNSKGENLYNVVMVGDSSVGKTSFMKRARSGKFSFDLPSSVGLDSCLWTVVVDGKPVVLQLWDTAGQERFHSITRQIFHKAQAFLLMYDITSPQSFSAVRYWTNCIQEGAVEDVTILLLGNKSDHAERQVATQEGEILAKEYNFDFMECSAATGENVVQSLEIVARLLSQKVDTSKEAVVLHKEPQKKKTSGCC